MTITFKKGRGGEGRYEGIEEQITTHKEETEQTTVLGNSKPETTANGCPHKVIANWAYYYQSMK